MGIFLYCYFLVLHFAKMLRMSCDYLIHIMAFGIYLGCLMFFPGENR